VNPANPPRLVSAWFQLVPPGDRVCVLGNTDTGLISDAVTGFVLNEIGGGRFRTSRRIWFLPFTVRALTANRKTVVDASESRAKKGVFVRDPSA